MNGYVAKPIEPRQLCEALAACLHRQPGPAPAIAAGEWDFPAVAGFDVDAALRRLGGKADLYHRLLRDFARDWGGAGARLAELLAAGDSEAAGRLAHTLRGVAGNLAAGAVARLAGDLARALKTGDAVRYALAGALAVELTQAIAAINALPAVSMAAEALPADEALDRLERILAKNSLTAADEARDILNGLAAAGMAVADLEGRVAALDFRGASRMVAALRAGGERG